MRNLSPGFVEDLLALESSTDVRILLTLESPDLDAPIRITDGFTQRLSETAEDIVYGVVSRGVNFTYIPMRLSLPTDLDSGAPRCQLTVFDVQRTLTPSIRSLTSPMTATIEVVSHVAPNDVEIEFPLFRLGAITYNAEQLSADLTVESDTQEPFPADVFSPGSFPGLF